MNNSIQSLVRTHMNSLRAAARSRASARGQGPDGLPAGVGAARREPAQALPRGGARVRDRAALRFC